MRVLIAYDGSESADQALELIAGLTWPAASECRLLVTCGEPFATSASVMVADASTLQAILDAPLDDAERLAIAISRRIDRPGLAVTWEVGLGRPASAILDAADRFQPDLLVVGSRRVGPIMSAVLGSVSDELLDRAQCPVLVARGTELRRVVLAEDGSRDAQAASNLLLRWPVFRGADIRVVGASIGNSRTHPNERAAIDGQQVAQEALAALEALVASTAGRLRRAGLSADTSVREGDPAAEILATAGDWSADLIILGSQGQTGLTRQLRGSVARKILEHAPCSVLIERRR